MSTAEARVVIIDDQVSYAEAFGLALATTGDLSLAGRAPDGSSGVELCVSLLPDIVVTDYRLPNGDTGVEVARRLRSEGMTMPIAILTGFVAPQVTRDAKCIPDVSVFSKDLPILDVVNGLRAALAGRPTLRTDPDDTPPDVVLSPGELEVIELLAQGHNAKQIAEILHLSLHTIRSRIKHLLRKLKATSQLEAIATATRLGLVVPPT